jgi:hypothetical protein
VIFGDVPQLGDQMLHGRAVRHEVGKRVLAAFVLHLELDSAAQRL